MPQKGVRVGGGEDPRCRLGLLQEERGAPPPGGVAVDEPHVQRAESSPARCHPGRAEHEDAGLSGLTQGPLDPLRVIPFLALRVVPRNGLAGDVEHAVTVCQLDDPAVGVGVPLDVLGPFDPQVQGGPGSEG